MKFSGDFIHIKNNKKKNLKKSEQLGSVLGHYKGNKVLCLQVERVSFLNFAKSNKNFLCTDLLNYSMSAFENVFRRHKII